MPDNNYDKMLRAYWIPDKPKEEKPAEKTTKALDPKIKRNWEDIQKKYKFPVNAIGVKIDPRDKETLRVWRENGIDQFVKE